MPNTSAGTSIRKWEQRWHPLYEEWIVYSAHRDQRPWKGDREASVSASKPYDPDCYLCPGNKRIHGEVNPAYTGVFCFDNDHPVVGPDAPEVSPEEKVDPLYRRSEARGRARVLCYHPRHDISLTGLDAGQCAEVFSAMAAETAGFRKSREASSVLVFENRGAIVGTSSPHPHCQIYGTQFPFQNVLRGLAAAERFRGGGGRGGNLFEAILEREQNDGLRIVETNEHAVAFVPFFARWAYEVWIFPRRRVACLDQLEDKELAALAACYQGVTRRYDGLFNMPFPYVMNLNQAPVDGGSYGDYHLHWVLQPPLRQPGLKKFPAGPELGGGNFMADTLPELKAAELRAVVPAEGETR